MVVRYFDRSAVVDHMHGAVPTRGRSPRGHVGSGSSRPTNRVHAW